MKTTLRPSVSSYRIHSVAELTGVAAPTLRAWERRYGVPVPRRTASAYRLYGPVDVAEIERMRDLCGQGVPAARAAATVTGERAASHGVTEPTRDSGQGRSIGRLVDAVIRLDGEAIERELSRAAERDDAVGVFDALVTPALEAIGHLQAQGELSGLHGHYASGRIGAFLLGALRRTHVADEGSRSVLLACFDEEQGELSLLGVALRASLWGFRPIFLGARTPPSVVGAAVVSARPALVALSVSTAPEPRRARMLAAAYGREIGTTPWMVGGAGAERIAPAIRRAGGIVVLEPRRGLHRASAQARRAAPDSSCVDREG